MAPLPKIDVQAIWIRDLLHRKKRNEACALAEKAIADGTAGDETKALAEYLRTAGKGRQPFGVRHRWFEIGQDNEEMRDQGMAYDERMAALKSKYQTYDESKFRTWIAKYEIAIDEIRTINKENL